VLLRAWGDRAFGAREQRLVELLHEELGRDGATRAPRLSRRQRDVLDLLCRGVSEKAVPAALELSLHHDHSSRSIELTACARAAS
jgi:DNA-binding NarL/FixJ family response regulator